MHPVCLFCRAAPAGESTLRKQLKSHGLLRIHIRSTAEVYTILPVSFNYLTTLSQVRAHSRPSMILPLQILMIPTTMGQHLVSGLKLRFLSTSILIGTGTN